MEKFGNGVLLSRFPDCFPPVKKIISNSKFRSIECKFEIGESILKRHKSFQFLNSEFIQILNSKFRSFECKFEIAKSF
jgi:hypothetical protein